MDLASIAPATKAVALGSAAVVVSGLSLRKLAWLITAYPELAPVLVGGKIGAATLLAQAPDAALAVFSLGVVGRARPPWWRRAGAMISDGEDFGPAFESAAAGQQIEIIGAIFDLTTKGSERALPFLKAALAPGPASASEPPITGAAPETSAGSTPASSPT